MRRTSLRRCRVVLAGTLRRVNPLRHQKNELPSTQMKLIYFSDQFERLGPW